MPTANPYPSPQSKSVASQADRHVCILGLGYVGLPLGAALAQSGLTVYGVEIMASRAADIADGKPHIVEPHLPEMLKNVLEKKQFIVSTKIPAPCPATIFIVTVGTPINEDQRCRLDMIKDVMHEIAEVLKDGDLVILRSTLKLGSTRSICIPILDRTGKDYDIAFCPERIIEGNAIKELHELPQIIGGSSVRAAARAAKLFSRLTPKIVTVSSIETAEIIKLIDNITRDIHFAISNEFGMLCEHLGLNSHEVFEAAQDGYKRTKIPKVGLVGGPCLSKDSYLLQDSFEDLALAPQIPKVARVINEGLPLHGANTIHKFAQKLPSFSNRPVLAVLGAAFKGQPETGDIRSSMTGPVVEHLRRLFNFSETRGFDPMVTLQDMESLRLNKMESLEEALQNADIVVIANNLTEIAQFPLDQMSRLMRAPGIIYDFWPQHRSAPEPTVPGVHYLAFGNGANQSGTP